jgi:dihydroxyacetone kinase
MRRAAAAIADPCSGFANSDSSDSNELQRQVSDLWIAACSGAEAKSVEDLKHCRVLRQNLGSQLFQSGVAGDCEQVTHERRPDPFALMGIDHDKRQFGLAGSRNDVAASGRLRRSAQSEQRGW